jgi:hypothetical protein
MEIVSIVAVLRRRRILLIVGILAAVAAGALVSGVRHSASAAQLSGEALAQVEIDTRVPLVATSAPGGDDTIVRQSVLLAGLMGSSTMTAEIARRAGIPPDDLFIRGPVLLPTSEFGLLPDGQFPVVASASSLSAVHTPDVVQLVPNYNLPIMQIGAVAPSVREAVSLTLATIATMRSATAATATATATATAKLAAAHRGARRSSAKSLPALNVESLGGVSSIAVGTPSIHILSGLAAAIALFAVWCTAIVIAAGVGRLWRSADRPVTEMAG